MDNQTTAVLISLIPFFAFGLTNALSKKYVNLLGSSQSIIYRNTIVIILLFITLLGFINESHFILKEIILGVFLSAISYFGLYFFYKGLELGKVGLVAPISHTRVFLASLIGITFLGDSITNLQFISIIIIFIGSALISLNLRSIKSSVIFSKKSGLGFALLAALFWGSTFPFFSHFSTVLGAFLFSFILEVTVLAMSLVTTLKTEGKIKLEPAKIKKYWLGLLIIGALSALASFSMNLAYKTGEISIVSAITSASPMISIIYAGIIFKERLTRQQYIASFLIIIGIIGLSYFR